MTSSITAHVYQIFIKGTPEQVWAAITESDWTERYFHQTRFDGPLVEGQPYATHLTSSGRAAIDGVVEELTPPLAGRPGRLVQTWHVLYDAALAAEHTRAGSSGPSSQRGRTSPGSAWCTATSRRAR